jgi:signal transduction histidine kinase/ActR/RegA family two-component response regulator
MRVTPTVAAMPLLLVLLTWLSVRAINSDAELFDRALAALDHVVVLENALNRDALSARSGMLRNYDPLVGEVNGLKGALGRLHKTAAGDADQTAAVDRLAASVSRQEELIEQFKSNNALLQNSLAYFQLFYARLVASDRDETLAPAVVALAASMLQLTLDTSPVAVREVEDRLDGLAALSAPSGEAGAVQALLAHGRLLHDLLPATDNVLKALFAVPIKPERATLRTIILARQSASRETARGFRVVLYTTSLVLLALLVHLGVQLRARARALQRRAAFEHVMAGISMRFIDAEPQDIGAHIELALARMAACVGADRTYFLVRGPSPQIYTWCRRGLMFEPGWPDRVLALMTWFSPTAEGIIYIPDASRLPPGEDKDAMAAIGLQGWACVSRTGADGVVTILGFDALRQPCHITQSAELGLLPMALETIANAVRRQFLERERGRLEMRLQQARRMETVGALASGIAHNFNNIVGAILGYAEMAEAHLASDSRPARNLDEIRRAGERARDLVDQILAFGRRHDVQRMPLSVKALVAEATSLLHASLPARIELIVSAVPDAATVSGEPGQLQQVILNLCNNAAQAMNGAGRIALETDVHEITRARPLSHGDLAPGHYARIAVSDAGRGMDDAIIERIFEPFFTTRPTGNGLGLATVREIVREHGGMMHVWSRPDGGSRFEIWLPCVAAAAPLPRRAAPTLPLGRGETVLIVDDESERLLRDEEILAALGYEPVGFVRVGEALAACRAAPDRFDVLLVGHLTPTGSALELATALHESAPDLPILLATASADEIAADALVAAGIFEVVRRPLNTIEIATALTRCLAGSGTGDRRATAVTEFSIPETTS